MHSLKDLPTEIDPRFSIAAVLVRETSADVLVARSGAAFWDLPSGAVIGTSSVRRATQVKRLRHDLNVESIRGNVETRLKKLHDPALSYQAVVFAEAGLQRLGLSPCISYRFTEDEMLPAPGQGALAIECRAEDCDVCSVLSAMDDTTTRAEVTAERVFLQALNAGCNTPVACRAHRSGDILLFTGRCLSLDGRQSIEVSGQGDFASAEALGRAMAEQAIRAFSFSV